MGKLFVSDIQEGTPVLSFFLVRQMQTRQKRSGESYLTFLLADRTGELPAVLWEGIEDVIKTVGEGDVVKIQGALGSYQGARQLTLNRLRPAQAAEITLEDYYPRSSKDPDELLERLQTTIDRFQNPFLRQLLTDILASQTVRPGLREAPAAKTLHHATLGGLLEHTASVVGLCERLAEHYPALDRDMLLAAAILHDIGKTRELTWERGFDYTDAGRLVGHITLGVLLVEEHIRRMAEFPAALGDRLIHCILSHHGELEWGSPKRPKTLEAMVLHYAEDLDGKINAFLNFSQAHPDPQRPGWTEFNRAMDRCLFFGPVPVTPPGARPDEAPDGRK
ncbi:MAG: HD domain-containing protein [candidate division NC10 bacterium]|nr:HD domain-containing protein [candidate division NC10 bacterium]